MLYCLLGWWMMSCNDRFGNGDEYIGFWVLDRCNCCFWYDDRGGFLVLEKVKR